LSEEQKKLRDSVRRQLGESIIFTINWYRFAGESEPEYLAEKFNQKLKQLRRK
jgi:hypothetical protein